MNESGGWFQEITRWECPRGGKPTLRVRGTREWHTFVSTEAWESQDEKIHHFVPSPYFLRFNIPGWAVSLLAQWLSLCVIIKLLP